MKRIFKYISLGIVLAAMSSCEYKHSEYPIYPDIGFSERGLYTVAANSVYPEQEVGVTIARTMGLSQELTMTIGLDLSVLDNYNELYNTQYALMPSEYFSFPEKISFAALEKTTVIPVKFKPASYIGDIGWNESRKYVIPLRIKSASTNVTVEESGIELILGFNVSPPTVTASNNQQFGLTFISGVTVPQSIALTADVNFTTLLPSKVTYEVYPSGAAAYNAAHGTDYLLLPENTYEIKAGSFDQENLLLTVPVEIKAWELDIQDTYILPLRIYSTEYTTEQGSDIYVIINVGEMKITIDKVVYNYPINKIRLTEDVVVRLNSIIDQDMVIEFTYDPADIEAYNLENGTSYKALDADVFTLPKGKIEAGSMKAELSLEVDISDVPYNEVAELDDKYLIIISIDEDKTLEGTQLIDQEIVITFEKTMYGYYDVVGDNNWMANLVEKTTAGTAEQQKEWPYMNKFYTWGDGFQWKVLWDTTWSGNPNWRRVIPWSTATSGPTYEEQVAWITDNLSYFDMEKGEILQSYKYYWNKSDKDAGTTQSNNCYLRNQRYPD